MKNRLFNIQIIGYLLAALYAASLAWFIFYIKVPTMQFKGYVYTILFALLVIGSIGVVRLQEWGRKLIVLMNTVLFVMLFSVYIKEVDIVPLCYFIMSIILILYFNQEKVKIQFLGKKVEKWRSVLIIDDDTSLIKIVRPILMSHGFSVLTAETGEEGIRVAETQSPDLILLDVILPGIKGRDVCKELKAKDTTKDIPVVFMTAKDSDDDIRAELEVGGETHLTKPVNARLLVSTINRILDK